MPPLPTTHPPNPCDSAIMHEGVHPHPASPLPTTHPPNPCDSAIMHEGVHPHPTSPLPPDVGNATTSRERVAPRPPIRHGCGVVYYSNRCSLLLNAFQCMFAHSNAFECIFSAFFVCCILEFVAFSCILDPLYLHSLLLHSSFSRCVRGAISPNSYVAAISCLR